MWRTKFCISSHRHSLDSQDRRMAIILNSQNHPVSRRHGRVIGCLSSVYWKKFTPLFDCFPGLWIWDIEKTRLWDHLFFIIEFSILERRYLYIEMTLNHTVENRLRGKYFKTDQYSLKNWLLDLSSVVLPPFVIYSWKHQHCRGLNATKATEYQCLYSSLI